MEFQYRAGDERSRSPPTLTGPQAPASASSGSAAARVRDGHGGDGTGYRGEISLVAAPSTTLPLASEPEDELRRQEAKERIRERILREEAKALREEAEALSLEAEVRHELVEERFPLRRSGLARPAPGARAEGAEARAAPAVGMTADSPSPIVLESMQPQPKANGSAALPAKRKNPGEVTATSAETSTLSAATSSKKQRAAPLTCKVCGITLTGEKPMQEHLKGKSHMRKTAMLAPPVPVAEHEKKEEHVICPNANASAAALPPKRENSDVIVAGASTDPAAASSKKQKPDLKCTVCGVTSTSEKSLQEHLRGKGHQRKAAALVLPPPPALLEHEEEGDYTPTKLNMLTNAGAMYEVTQMNGFILCEVCDVRTADLVTMMCHLEGSKHTSKVQQKQLPGARNPPAPVPAATDSKKRVKGRRAAPPATTAAVAGAGGDPKEVKNDVPAAAATVGGAGGDPKEVKNGVPAAAATVGGSCHDVKAPPERAMRSHDLAGKKLEDTSNMAAVHVGTGGRKAAVLANQAKSNEVSVIVAGTGQTIQGNDSMKGQAAGEVEVHTPQVDDVVCAGASVPPMEVDEHAEVGHATAVAEEEKAAGDVNSSATLQGKEPVKARPARDVKIQVEGKVCTNVVRQADGTLSCVLCGVHGCDKDGMLQHLYTSAHWVRIRLAEEKAAPPMVNHGSDGGVKVAEGTVGS